MRLRRGALLATCALLGAAVAVLPGVAGSETSPSISAESYGSPGVVHHRWAPPTATVGEGGVVALSNPSTEVPHGVEWVGGPTTPVCSGVPVGKGFAHSATSWSGTCTFAAAGTYVFYCNVHGPEMTGTITVNGDGSTTTTMTTPTTATTTTAPTNTTSPTGSSPPTSPAPAGAGTQTTGGPSSAGPLGSLLAGRPSAALKLATAQHGRAIRGSLALARAADGGRLEVQLLAARASLASTATAAALVVGRAVRSSLRAGTVSFSVALDARARHALRVRRHLALTVKLVLSAPHGAPVTLARGVLVRG